MSINLDQEKAKETHRLVRGKKKAKSWRELFGVRRILYLSDKIADGPI